MASSCQGIFVTFLITLTLARVDFVVAARRLQNIFPALPSLPPMPSMPPLSSLPHLFSSSPIPQPSQPPYVMPTLPFTEPSLPNKFPKPTLANIDPNLPKTAIPFMKPKLSEAEYGLHQLPDDSPDRPLTTFPKPSLFGTDPFLPNPTLPTVKPNNLPKPVFPKTEPSLPIPNEQTFPKFLESGTNSP